MVEQLDGDVVPAERLDEAGELARRRGRSPGDKRGRHGAAPAAGEDAPVTPVGLGKEAEIESGPALLPPGEMGPGDRRRQPGVPFGVSRQHDEVRRLGIDRAGPRLGSAGRAGRQRELGAKDGPQRELPGRRGKADDAVAPVVVGERERLEAETRRLRGERLGARGAIEEAEVRVAVQLRVGHLGPADPGTFRRGGDRVVPRVLRRGPWRRVPVPPPRETTLELRPGDDRVERTDRTTIANICSIR